MHPTTPNDTLLTSYELVLTTKLRALVSVSYHYTKTRISIPSQHWLLIRLPWNPPFSNPTSASEISVRPLVSAQQPLTFSTTCASSHPALLPSPPMAQKPLNV